MVLVALLAPPGTLLLLRTVPALDLVLRSAPAHLVVVTAISACALAVAVAAATAAGRSRDGSLVLLALGCLGVGFLMLGHGLMTPGVAGRPPNLWVGRLPVLAIAVFTACLGLAAWPQRAAAAWAGRWPRATLTAGGAMLALALIAVSLWPTAGVGARSLPGEADIRLALVLASALVLVALGAMHWQRWRLERDRMQLALVVACLLSAGALLSLQLGRLWHLAWWDYHAFLLAGFAAAIYAVLTGYRRSRTLQEVLGEVFASDPMAHISRGYSETLRVLIGAVEARDAYTHGHSARVAELSVQVGLRLGLRPAALRTLAEGPTCTTSARSASPTTSLTSRAPLPRRSGPGSRNTPLSAPTSSGGRRRCATPWR
ncbi:MAG: metal dependent phosphohydrolase [Actinomycetia bacterium]|nr:metal dependent phosphohydrolase [Actinomycetes bacterium]